MEQAGLRPRRSPELSPGDHFVRISMKAENPLMWIM
jgi:hypothetical protein